MKVLQLEFSFVMTAIGWSLDEFYLKVLDYRFEDIDGRAHFASKNTADRIFRLKDSGAKGRKSNFFCPY